jgi:hypothetical protein
VANHYPLPEIMIDKELVQKFHWSAIAFSEETQEYFSALMDQSDVPLGPISPEFIMAMVLRLIRNLAF